MKIKVFRYKHAKNHTNSLFFIDDKYFCEGLEPAYQVEKIVGETRIFSGIYDLGIRDYGGFHEKYLKRFGSEFHKGMLHILNVPNFKYVLIHIGNSSQDTDACYLTGYSNSKGMDWISESTNAYKIIYPIIIDSLLKKEKTTIEFINL